MTRKSIKLLKCREGGDKKKGIKEITIAFNFLKLTLDNTKPKRLLQVLSAREKPVSIELKIFFSLLNVA